MRKLCPNYNLEDGLETVLEVPMPEELFSASKTKPGWNQMKSFWSKPTATATATTNTNMTRLFGGRNAEIQLLLGVVGAPLIPLPVQPDHHNDYENHSKAVHSSGRRRTGVKRNREHVRDGESEDDGIRVLHRRRKPKQQNGEGKEYQEWRRRSRRLCVVAKGNRAMVS